MPVQPLVELDPDGTPIVLSYDLPDLTASLASAVQPLRAAMLPDSVPTEAQAAAALPLGTAARVGETAQAVYEVARSLLSAAEAGDIGPASAAAADITAKFGDAVQAVTDLIVEASGNVTNNPEAFATANAWQAKLLSDEGALVTVASAVTGLTAPAQVPTAAASPDPGLDDATISNAYATAQSTGYFDPTVFPGMANVKSLGLAAVRRALSGLDTPTVVAHVRAGGRLVLYRDTSGRVTYGFLPRATRRGPALLLVEHYRLSSFPARYGAGRTIKTFSLLPGEKTTIRVNTHKRSSQTMTQVSSILDSTSDDTESDFERSVLAQQTAQDASDKSLEYHAEAKVDASASWGSGKASLQVSGGIKGGTNSVSRTLNFVFRQMNRVAFFDGLPESRTEVPLPQLDDLLDTYIVADRRQGVRDLITAELRGTRDHTDTPRPDFVQTVTVPGGRAGDTGYERVNPNTTSSYQVGTGGPVFTVPGVIVSADAHVLRTGAVIVDTFLGLDDYSRGQQEQAVRAREIDNDRQLIDNDRQRAEIERLRLALHILDGGDEHAAALYRRLFPLPQIINQIEQAAIGTPPPDGSLTGDSTVTATP